MLALVAARVLFESFLKCCHEWISMVAEHPQELGFVCNILEVFVSDALAIEE